MTETKKNSSYICPSANTQAARHRGIYLHVINPALYGDDWSASCFLHRDKSGRLQFHTEAVQA